MTGPAHIDDLAAEYVLGTLSTEERVAVSARLQRELPLQAAVAYWEKRLAPLDELAPPIVVPIGLKSRIDHKIAAVASGAIAGGSVVTLDVHDLQRRLRHWRTSALAATAIAASLAVILGAREMVRPPLEQNFVAVFQKDDASPSFVMSVDLASRTLSVRRVAADVPSGKTFQLWIASDKLGVGPQSLGLVEDRVTEVKKAISGIDPSIVQNALFGVSLEPAGGSPTGKPTGPVFHAKLIQTSG